MAESDDLPESGADRVVEREETYGHDEHGSVEVTGIWKGVNRVDEARNMNQEDVIIVRYSTKGDGQQVDELTDTLSEFLGATS